MNQGVINVEAAFQAAVASLNKGDAQSARAILDQIAAAGQANASVWHAMAVARQRLGDKPGMLAALDSVLAINKYHWPALLMKGDHYAEAGDERAALSFYIAVGSLIEQMPNATPDARAAYQRAESMKKRYSDKMRAHLDGALAGAGFKRGQSSGRIAHTLDLLTGARQTYFQQPRALFVPELAHIQFWPREKLPWMDAIEAATDDICAELEAVMRTEDDFVPYIQNDPDRPPGEGLNLIDKKDWSAFFLVKNGERLDANAERCPRTMAALADAPLTGIKGRAPSILFSRLLPRTQIPPHHGFLNSRLICHLPLIVPPGCRFRVGNETREWVKGKAWAFDDSIEHEADNPTDQTRIILIFEVWRPELSEEERTLIATLMEAVDTYQGEYRTQWDV